MIGDYAATAESAAPTHPGFYQKVIVAGDRFRLLAPTLRRYSVQGIDGAAYQVETKADARLKKGGRDWYSGFWRLDNEYRVALNAALRAWRAAAQPYRFEWVDLDGGEAYR